MCPRNHAQMSGVTITCFIPACGMLQQVVFVVLTAVQALAAVPWVEAGVSPKLPWALLDVFQCCSLNYSSI